MNKLLKPLGSMAVIIIFFSIVARLLSRGETLMEYADANPEIAYATPAGTEEPVSPTPAATAEPAAGADNAPVPSGDTVYLPAAGGGSSASASPDNASPAPAGSPPSDTDTADTVHYKEGFSYQPLSDDVIRRITGISYPVEEETAPLLPFAAVNIISDKESLAVSYDDLRYMNVLYHNFDGEVKTGELICNKKIAQDLAEIFYELYINEYRIEKISLIDEYNGDDTASMEDNNTSCFNYRLVDGSSNLSRHALGLAIDINPFYNPYVVFNKDGSGQTYISPEGSEIYADRSRDFPYKIDENDLCYRLFTDHGFIWGGNWNSMKDYQHFQKIPD